MTTNTPMAVEALRNERERCAQLAIAATDNSKDGNIVARAIREGR